MKPSEIITYLNNLADEFQRMKFVKDERACREAAALIAQHNSAQLTSLTMTLGDQVFNMMTGQHDERL